MAYEYEIVAWEAFPRKGQSRGDRHPVDHDRQGNPILPPSNRVHGVKVKLRNPHARGDTHQYWLFTLQRFQKWGQWFVYIVGMGAEHGFAFEDETSDPTLEEE